VLDTNKEKYFLSEAEKENSDPEIENSDPKKTHF
jgi:hypothetical protein